MNRKGHPALITKGWSYITRSNKNNRAFILYIWSSQECIHVSNNITCDTQKMKRDIIKLDKKELTNEIKDKRGEEMMNRCVLVEHHLRRCYNEGTLHRIEDDTIPWCPQKGNSQYERHQDREAMYRHTALIQDFILLLSIYIFFLSRIFFLLFAWCIK